MNSQKLFMLSFGVDRGKPVGKGRGSQGFSYCIAGVKSQGGPDAAILR